MPEINGKGGEAKYSIVTTTLNTQSLQSLPGSSRVCEIQKGTRETGQGQWKAAEVKQEIVA